MPFSNTSTISSPHFTEEAVLRLVMNG